MSKNKKKIVNQDMEVKWTDFESRAIELLKLVQEGISIIIGGSGPYDDKISGSYYQGMAGGASKRFLLSQWNEEVEKLLAEVESGNNK